ncbi:DUF4040 family protein [Corynebacterium pseudodiphtheriticum]|uniref:DUF4040 family protein n=1 Tax=Corynebacterium pseudodiphtheriticum TaxID=37637 RepID=UPI0020BEFF54|nr:DUF4040 family protein [Corynebacterium pseudodiphtheriticum]UQV53446.1 DUF4040 family protein [Corynebacterium pseudodiphtheriticum]
MIFSLLALLGVTVASAPLLSRLLGRNAGWVLALPLIVATIMGVAVYDGIHTESVPWIPSLGVDFNIRLDGLSFVFLLLVLVIGAGVLMYSTRYLHHKDSAFYFFITGFAAAMALLVTTDNLFVFYVAWEMTTLCSFFLIGNSGEKGQQPAIRTLLVTVLGGLLLLTATIIMSVSTATLQLSEVIASDYWADNPGTLTVVAMLIAGAAFTKSAQFPFQAWLPDSMVAIAPVSAYLHAAAMVKAGIYLILRYSPLFGEVAIWNILLIVCGLFTAAFGAMTAVTRDDLKELLAYSTMSQLGLLVATVGIGTDAALTAAIVHTIAHACFKAALFMSVGIVEHESGTRLYSELHYVRTKMPVTKTLVVIAATSMAGIPALFGFVSKEGLIEAALDAPFGDNMNVLITAGVVVTSMFTFVYSFKYIIGVFGARRSVAETDVNKTVPEAAFTFWVIPALLALLTLALGVYPGAVDTLVDDAALAATGADQHVHLAIWHGFNMALGMSALIVLVGIVLVLNRDQLFRAMSVFGAPLTGLYVVEFLRQGIINTGGKYFTAATGTTSMRRHLVLPLLGVISLAVIGIFTLNDLPEVVGERAWAIDWIFVLLVAMGCMATVMAKSRLTVVVVVSIAGFGMTLWFYVLGAADVANTQLTVEILTVCVLVLILHRLPDHFTPDTRRSHFWSIVLSVAVGISTMLAVLALTGRREISDVSEYFLRETEELTGGSNIVNVILVEFRAFDTLGELTVLGVAGIAIAVLLSNNRLLAVHDTHMDKHSPLIDARANSVFLRSTSKLVGPIIVALSILLFFRGHNEAGGGFVAALIASAGFALVYLAAPSNAEAKIRLPYMALIGSGITVAVATGLLGFVEGSFLRPLDTHIFGLHLSTALLFDLGVYLAVIGMILAAFNLLGMPRLNSDEADAREPGADADLADRSLEAEPQAERN